MTSKRKRLNANHKRIILTIRIYTYNAHIENAMYVRIVIAIATIIISGSNKSFPLASIIGGNGVMATRGQIEFITYTAATEVD